jgi:hypothetical protein
MVFVYPVDRATVLEHDVVRAVLVDRRSETSRAKGEGHSDVEDEARPSGEGEGHRRLSRGGLHPATVIY